MAGRPKLYDKVLSVGFTDQQSAYIAIEAATRRVALGEVVRDAVQRALEFAGDKPQLMSETDRAEAVL